MSQPQSFAQEAVDYLFALQCLQEMPTTFPTSMISELVDQRQVPSVGPLGNPPKVGREKHYNLQIRPYSQGSGFHSGSLGCLL